MAELVEKLQTPPGYITSDWRAAVAPADRIRTWILDTGNEAPDGTPIYLRLTIRDPRDPLLLAAVSAKFAEGKQHEAMQEVRQFAIEEPIELREASNFAQLSNALQSVIQLRLLRLMGMTADFLSEQERLGVPGALRKLVELPKRNNVTDLRPDEILLSKLPNDSDSTPSLSSERSTPEAGDQTISSPPTSTPVVENSKNAVTGSRTTTTSSPTSSPKPSAGSAPSTSPTPQKVLRNVPRGKAP